MNYPRIMISAPCSGSGKSVITAGLMAAFSRNNVVQGFKVGPDYIDPMYHSAATGRPSRNLDSWMLNAETNRRIFTRATQDADLAIIEGVMGLFDGFGSNPFVGSSAEMAKLLGCPVIAVIDCGKMSGSAAAIVKGLDSLDPGLRLAGVICNRVGSQAHADWLKDAIERYTNTPVLGAVPKSESLKIPERQLGLFTVVERPCEVKTFLENLAKQIGAWLDLDKILEIAQSAPNIIPEISVNEKPIQDGRYSKVRIAVALDEAFCFYYQENLTALEEGGAELVYFSPLSDAHLPERIGGIYLGGGYPELYAETISNNNSLLREIRYAHEEEMPIYAECGGFILLTEGIRSPKGDFPMTGVLPGWAEMGTRLKMGYRQIRVLENNLLSKQGDVLRGHEFHYSTWEPDTGTNTVYAITPRSQTENMREEGWSDKNLLASYVHLHFLQNQSITKNFINKCQQWSLKNTNE